MARYSASAAVARPISAERVQHRAARREQHRCYRGRARVAARRVAAARPVAGRGALRRRLRARVRELAPLAVAGGAALAPRPAATMHAIGHGRSVRRQAAPANLAYELRATRFRLAFHSTAPRAGSAGGREPGGRGEQEPAATMAISVQGSAAVAGVAARRGSARGERTSNVARSTTSTGPCTSRTVSSRPPLPSARVRPPRSCRPASVSRSIIAASPLVVSSAWMNGYDGAVVERAGRAAVGARRTRDREAAHPLARLARVDDRRPQQATAAQVEGPDP